MGERKAWTLSNTTAALTRTRRQTRRWLTFWYLAFSGLRPLRFSLRGLGFRDRSSVLVAFVYLSYVESFLRHADGDFGELVELCITRASTGQLRLTPEAQQQLPDQACWSVQVAMGCIPRTRCLAEAFTVYLLLRRRGLPVSVVIGVCRSQRRKVSAHAWVELDSEPLYQSIMTRWVYAPIVRVG